ncbi:MAG: hypothetical protein KAI41_05115, partial [Hyphomicrobiaceae bacterium]|nr:hypothetical protein [Hyphomicrobiaceae bacterium]
MAAHKKAPALWASELLVYGEQCAVLAARRRAAVPTHRDEDVLTYLRADRSGPASRFSSRKEVIQP